MLTFAAAAALGWILLVGIFRLLRGPDMARFLAFTLGLQTVCAIVTFRVMGPFQPLGWALQATVWLWLVRAWTGRMPRPWWSAVIGIPANTWAVATLLSVPWGITGITFLTWIPYVLALAGMFASLSTRKETLRIDLGVPLPATPSRFPGLVTRVRGHQPRAEGLRIVHLTDPHLGVFMSVRRLQGICARAVAAKPDLILLTGDFFTFESSGSPLALARALEPLKAHKHVYACRGNHDVETPDSVDTALTAAGVRLLIDEAVTVETRVGPVQLLGFDFRWQDRVKHFRRVLVEVRRPPGALRIALLHDPSACGALPPKTADLVLSGHTHGGQIGLVSFGLPWTVVGGIFRMPDHGPWAINGNRLYVNRAAGHYGFQLRLGVPAEESILEVIPA